MKTFKEYLLEQATGNYVAVYAKDGIEFPGLKYHSGTLVTPDKQHVTLMYSTETNLKPQSIKLKSITDYFTANVTGVDSFDDGDEVAIVLLLSSQVLQSAHQELIDLGLTHTYDFNPHLTVLYKVNAEDKDAIIAQLQKLINNKAIILNKQIVSEPIKSDWVSTLKEN